MPNRPRRIPRASLGGKTARKQTDRAYQRARQRYEPEHDRFYRRKAWTDLRALKLDRNPICEDCDAVGLVNAATDVDHIFDRRKRPDLELAIENLRALCKSCHSRKTRKGG